MSAHYIICSDPARRDQIVKALGWRSFGRSSWLKPDGTEVHYLHFVEQLAIIERGDTVHVVGRPAKIDRAQGQRRNHREAIGRSSCPASTI